MLAWPRWRSAVNPTVMTPMLTFASSRCPDISPDGDGERPLVPDRNRRACRTGAVPEFQGQASSRSSQAKRESRRLLWGASSTPATRTAMLLRGRPLARTGRRGGLSFRPLRHLPDQSRTADKAAQRGPRLGLHAATEARRGSSWVPRRLYVHEAATTGQVPFRVVSPATVAEQSAQQG